MSLPKHSMIPTDWHSVNGHGMLCIAQYCYIPMANMFSSTHSRQHVYGEWQCAYRMYVQYLDWGDDGSSGASNTTRKDQSSSIYGETSSVNLITRYLHWNTCSGTRKLFIARATSRCSRRVEIEIRWLYKYVCFVAAYQITMSLSVSNICRNLLLKLEWAKRNSPPLPYYCRWFVSLHTCVTRAFLRLPTLRRPRFINVFCENISIPWYHTLINWAQFIHAMTSAVSTDMNRPTFKYIITLIHAFIKAKLWEISSDTHQLYYIPKHHFII